jgi:GMP synthase-like glutamine amidotransferase
MIDRARVLVFQHLDSEGPGTIGDYLRTAGLALTVVKLDQGEAIPALDDFALMLVMGGPMDVWQEDEHPWMTAEKAAIRRWAGDLGRPYLGVCLGHQLLADALGGLVGRMSEPEIGVTEMALTAAGRHDATFAALSIPLRGLQWHGAQVLRPPPGGVVLASNAACAIQAMRVGPWAWGVQFHLEVSAATIAEWWEVPEYRAALAALGHDDSDWLADAVTLTLPSMRRNADTLLADVVAAVRRDDPYEEDIPYEEVAG